MGDKEVFDLDKYRSIGMLRPGYKKAKKVVRHEKDGSREVEHWDGRQDAHIVARPVKSKSTVRKD